jgi:hypothetical protein
MRKESLGPKSAKRFSDKPMRKESLGPKSMWPGADPAIQQRK